MHPNTTHQLALQNQRRLLDQAAADRLARVATAGRPSPLTRLVTGFRRTAGIAGRHADPRPATTGRA